MVEAVHVETVAIVIPVYKGEATLSRLVEEIAPLTEVVTTPRGQRFQVAEIILVHDGAVDGSQRVMEAIGGRFAFVRLVWLARNFGQHPATLAGAACSTAGWVVTLDEDGDHDPAAIGQFLDVALESGNLVGATLHRHTEQNLSDDDDENGDDRDDSEEHLGTSPAYERG